MDDQEKRLRNIFGNRWFEGEKKLNVGCGRRHYEGWINLDKYPIQHPDVLADLNKPLPFDDNTFDVILASHVLEHVDDVVSVVAELNRILKVGGHLIAAVPHAYSWVGFANPFHKNYFIPATFSFFLKSAYTSDNAGLGDNEGKVIGDWEISYMQVVPKDEYIPIMHTQEFQERAAHQWDLLNEICCIMTKTEPQPWLT